MPYSEDPGRGRGERHDGVSAQHQLQSLGPARTVSPPVCSQPWQWKGQNAKVRVYLNYCMLPSVFCAFFFSSNDVPNFSPKSDILNAVSTFL